MLKISFSPNPSAYVIVFRSEYGKVVQCLEFLPSTTLAEVQEAFSNEATEDVQPIPSRSGAYKMVEHLKNLEAKVTPEYLLEQVKGIHAKYYAPYKREEN